MGQAGQLGIKAPWARATPRPRGKRRCLLDDRLADHRPPNRGLAPSCKEGRAQQEEQMKQSVLVGLSVLALAACYTTTIAADGGRDSTNNTSCLCGRVAG